VKIGLIPSYWLYYKEQFGFTLQSYLERLTEATQKKQARAVQRFKEKGQEYYTPGLSSKNANRT